MNTRPSSTQPPSPQWSSQDLVDAVPQRLSDLISPELLRFPDLHAANGVALSPWAFDWRRRDDFNAFRVR
ncbi:hypothetical protein [Lysobacter terrae]